MDADKVKTREQLVEENAIILLNRLLEDDGGEHAGTAEKSKDDKRPKS